MHNVARSREAKDVVQPHRAVGRKIRAALILLPIKMAVIQYLYYLFLIFLFFYYLKSSGALCVFAQQAT